MTPTVSIDMTEFNAAMKQLLATTSRTLPEFLNARMFYWLLRAFCALDPKSPQSERNRIAAYMKQQVGETRHRTLKSGKKGKAIARSRQLQRRHLIAQAQNKAAGRKGLYGSDMREAAGSLLRKSVGSVGFMKSVIAKAIKKANGHFSQFGYATKKTNGKQVAGNAALISLANQYGLDQSNVAMHKGAYASTRAASNGFNPQAQADMAIGIADDQLGRVSFRYAAAFQRATFDELDEMRKQLAKHMQLVCNEHMEKPL